MDDEPARIRRRWPRRVAWVVGALIILATFVATVLIIRFRSSLPVLDGELTVVGLAGPVTITRDGRGIPTITGDRLDVAFATGFVHAQDRFFQMDLTRRAAAGELSALVGKRALKVDRARRIHRSRAVASEALERMAPRHRAILDHYAAGVNAGLGALGALPFEYLLLRTDPRAWQAVDTVLCMLAMFYDLQDEAARHDRMRGVMRDALPAPLVAWLTPRGHGRWDAAIDDTHLPVSPMPGPDTVDLRTMPQWQGLKEGRLAHAPVVVSEIVIGSNSWAVSGAHTPHGGALMANDAHLGLRVPATWYRAAWRWMDGETERYIEGVTIPGGPVIIIGSNGDVAWGFTNSKIDTVDAVRLELDGEGYRTPDGTEAFTVHRETIDVADGDPVEFEYRWTRWGPVVDAEHGRPTAIRWTGHEAEAINFAIVDLEVAGDLDAALDTAARGGIPPHNMVAADKGGRIGWTVMGYVPERAGRLPTAAPVPAAPIDPTDTGTETDDESAGVERTPAPAPPPLFVGYDGRMPRLGTDRHTRWKGPLPADRVPRVVDPPSGLIWTANSRIVGGDAYALLGEDAYVLGARQQQVRDALRARVAEGKVTARDMLPIQLDDRALLLAPWRDHLSALVGQAEPTPLRARLLHHLDKSFSGRASVESVGYRLVREIRTAIIEQIIGALTAPARTVYPDFEYLDRAPEGPVWQMITDEPAHLLHPAHASWAAWQIAIVDETLAALTTDAPDPVAALDRRTWGERNTADIHHPLASAIPLLGERLAAPRTALPGDAHVPRVQSPDNGASKRIGVSPGRESEGYMQFPGGQSGHPLSPYFLDQYADWVDGTPSPFAAGPAAHTLTLTP